MFKLTLRLFNVDIFLCWKGAGGGSRWNGSPQTIQEGFQADNHNTFFLIHSVKKSRYEIVYKKSAHNSLKTLFTEIINEWLFIK